MVSSVSVSPVEEGFISVLQRLQHFPLADVVWLDSALDDLVLRLLLCPGGPALPVLCHDDLRLLLLVQSKM